MRKFIAPQCISSQQGFIKTGKLAGYDILLSLLSWNQTPQELLTSQIWLLLFITLCLLKFVIINKIIVRWTVIKFRYLFLPRWKVFQQKSIMAHAVELIDARNNFYIGNYQNCLKLLQSINVSFARKTVILLSFYCWYIDK